MVKHFDGKTSLWCFQTSAVETNWADLRGSSLKPSNDAILKMAVCIIALVLKNDVGGSLALIKSFQVARSITFAENWPDAIFVCIYMFLVLFKYIRNVFIFFLVYFRSGFPPIWPKIIQSVFLAESMLHKLEKKTLQKKEVHFQKLIEATTRDLPLKYT